MKIEIGDKVKIIGDCEQTNSTYAITSGMEEYIHTNNRYTVERLLTRDNEIVGIRVKNYSWHIDDIVLVEKANGNIVHEDFDVPESIPSKNDFFKFDDSSIKSIIA